MERHPLTPPARPLVLLVDGQQDALALSALALSSLGFDVMAARDSSQAFTRASERHPDIIVTELVLRPESGWELLDHLKRAMRTRDIPVVFLTDDARSIVSERARRAGCAALFIKPCLPAQLATGIREVLVHEISHAPAPPSA